MVKSNSFLRIRPVPQAKELVDICLSKTNRKTPTVIHKHFEITRIRNFYIRKVRHCGGEFIERLERIVNDFPVMDDIHPFYTEQLSILYDKDTYKMTLGKINATKIKISNMISHSAKMIRFGDSMYRCKSLKRAGLGQMASTVSKLGSELEYLEKVRQDINRLPMIDPMGRIILVAGFPNVGKSSFVSAISKCKSEVMPFAFTTKALFVGHVTYKDLTYQIIDTPGILDHNLDERNRIEMLSISAIAHLKSIVLYFIDISVNSEYSIEEQIKLFDSLSPLVSSRFLIVLSKADLTNRETTENEILTNFLSGKNYVEISIKDEGSLNNCINNTCEIMLQDRVEEKVERCEDYKNRINFINNKNKVETNTEVMLGINKTYKNSDENVNYFTKDKYDIIPEIMNGKNISDFMHNKNLKEMLEQIELPEIKDYDCLTAEEQELYEKINRCRIAANMKSHFSKRGFIKKGHVIEEGLMGAEEFARVNKGRIKLNKKVKKNDKEFIENPKHLFRATSNKHARTR